MVGHGRPGIPKRHRQKSSGEDEKQRLGKIFLGRDLPIESSSPTGDEF
jgi:hypothetical protein